MSDENYRTVSTSNLGLSLPLDFGDARYIVPPLVASGVASLASELSPYPARTAAVYGLEGALVAPFQAVTHPFATQLFAAVYVLVYPLLLLFTYVALKREGGGRHVRYATTYTAVILVATPVFYFVPVGVTGYYLDSVEPLLYERSGVVGSSMTAVDTLRKALPSLHAGLATTASLYAPEGYAWLSWATTALVLLSTLYLGIHWLVDLVAGVALAYGCYRLTPAMLGALRATRRHLER